MPNHTFFTSAESGKMLIKNYDSNDTQTSLKNLALSPSTTNQDLIFHSDFNFLTIVGTVTQSSVTLPAFTRNVHSWSSGGKCFISTAACEIMGLDDYGPALQTLRNYRDGWMSETEEGRKLVQEYYEMAPDVVDAMNSLENPIEAYSELYHKYIMKAVTEIENDQNEEALHTYRSMCDVAKGYLGE